MGLLQVLSGLCGWIYTFCWSASFYPQLLLNLRRRSTSGTTVDFPFINVLGFVAYFFSTLALYYSPVVRSQYAARHKGLTPTVQFNDMTFALHASVLSAVTVSQYLARSWWRFGRSAGARPSRFIVGVAAGSLLALVITWALVASASAGGRVVDPARDWCELDLVYALGYVKLVISIIKLWPQILTNHRNRSTKGWSVWQVTLDLAGGVLSTAQQGIDSYLQHDWSGITGNPIKFALGNTSFVYDSIFLAQHYVLYRDAEPGSKREGDEERQTLRSDEDATDADADAQNRRRRLD
ncbi:hypothetical protein E4U42_007524 [Claviceps africana]|uniref:Cystinosin n=1 Tax=Claviceps africana TaxID=83212 RepID=A0A8K0J1T0_9HYPO|nr:hypothetical protein E4U42_007524 [Claviceps africana]